jgi:XTP/dITP diphosphohydrolase
MRELIFATGNQAKLAQLAFVIAALKAPVRLIAARERYGELAAYDEAGSTAAAISRHGAQVVAKRLGVPVLVEDTTFHVAALGGAPGVHAGRYLIEHGRAGILKALEGQTRRDATIVSAVSWATPEGDVHTWVTALQGQVAFEERWLRGLPAWIAPTPDDPLGGGYNAIFIPHGIAYTLAEVPPEDALHLGYREPNFCAAITFLLEHPER